MEVAKVSSKGQITIPKEVREKLKLETGSKVVFLQRGADWVVINPDPPIKRAPSTANVMNETERNRFLRELAAQYDVQDFDPEDTDIDIDTALERIRESFKGVASELGWETDQDVVDYIKRLRSGELE